MTAPLPLTRGRRLALIVGVPLAFALIAVTGLNWVALAGQGSYPVRLAVPVRGGTVSLQASWADVYVTQAAGSRLRLTGTAHYSLIRSTVTWHTTKSGVTVMPKCHFVIGVCSFNFAAKLPEGKKAHLSDGSGDLTLAGLSGPVDAGSGSGNVRADLLTGTVSLQSGSGDVSGRVLSGPRVTLRDGSGDISISGLVGARVTASDGSGDVSLTFSKVPSLVRVNDSSGNVTLVLPPGRTPYRVNASTGSGNRAVAVPTSSVSPHVIVVTDGSGDISITN
jgi:Putative adhesin